MRVVAEAALGLLLLLLLLLLFNAHPTSAQDGDLLLDGETNTATEEKKGVEVAQYFTEFTRQGPYPYQVCDELPGEIGEDPVTATARCIPVEAGELEFCGQVAYDACMRVVSPVVYDEELQAAAGRRLGQWGLEFPELASAGECSETFNAYICLLGFPRCEEDSENPGTFLELPLCYDYCVDAHFACIGDQTLAVRIAPNDDDERPSVTQTSRLPDSRSTRAADQRRDHPSLC